MDNNKEGLCKYVSFLLEEIMSDYQKEVWSTVLDYWDRDVHLVFDKEGRRVGRSTIAEAMYWLLADKGKSVLFMSRYLTDNTIPKADLIPPTIDFHRHGGKKVDVIIFDECCVEEIDKALSMFDAKGIIFNNNERLNLEHIASDFIDSLDEVSDGVMVGASKQWSNLSELDKLSVATAFATRAQPNFMRENHVYKNFNIEDGRDAWWICQKD